MKKPKSTSLFEIRLPNLEHGVVVLKGNADQAPAVLLLGRIVLAVLDPLSIRKLSLRVYATLRLDFEPERGITRPRFERKLHEYVWDASETQEYLTRLLSSSSVLGFGSIGGSSLGASASSSARSSAIFGAASPNEKILQTLPPGNYEIPFSTLLPGTIPESVEGLPGAVVSYRIEATLDRGKFHSSLVATKRIRVVRTLTSDAIELSESIAVDNTWPQKVEYSLSIPTRAIAIGSGTSITCTLVPLLKGLTLGKIQVQLVEYWLYVGVLPPASTGERVVCEKNIPAGTETIESDTWQIDTFLNVPANLSQCTQDCDITQYLKVRHKLKFVLALVNPDGHTSELRALLPVILFISPYVDVDSEDLIAVAPSLVEAVLPSLLSGFTAPPVYERHIYDRLWSDVSPAESPIGSGSVTPRVSDSVEDLNQFSMSPMDATYLSENLGRLSLERGATTGEVSPVGASSLANLSLSLPPGFSLSFASGLSPTLIPIASASSASEARATFNLGGEQDEYFAPRRVPTPSNQLFSNSPPANLLYSGPLSPPAHLSRASSELDVTTLNKVPLYSQALKSDSLDEVLAPIYAPPKPGSHVNLAEVNRKFEEMSQGHALPTAPRRTLLSRGSSSISLKSLGRSTATSPLQLRSASSTNLRGASSTSPGSIAHALPQRLTGSAGSSANASSANIQRLSHNTGTSSTSSIKHIPTERPTSGLTLPSSGLSMHNLPFLHKKRDK